MGIWSLYERLRRLERIVHDLTVDHADTEFMARHAYLATHPRSEKDVVAVEKIILPKRPVGQHPIDRLYDFLPKPRPDG